jgi:hypothetical protein
MTTHAGCDNAMTYAGCDAIGADGSYPDAAAKAVQDVAAKNPSAFYGYIRSGVHQKIYLFPVLDDAASWFAQAEPADYTAVFAQADLRTPYQGMEHFNAVVSGEQIGNWALPLIALPLGALAGYYYRRWQDTHPGKVVPFIQGDQSVGRWGGVVGSQVGGPWHEMVGAQPWLDMVPTVGGPWHEMVGAQANADTQRMAEWPQTRALIQSAIDAVTEAASMTPAEAYVWHLDAPTTSPYAGSTPGSTVVLEPTSLVEAFNTQAQALARLREVALTRPIALAMFERSTGHWPNPTAWRKSSDPADAPLIAQYVASRAQGTQMSGAYVGADPVASTAIAAVRQRAQQLADRRAGNVVGVIHTPKDNLWHTLAFRNEDDADDWIELAAQSPDSFTYAAYFNKNAPQWPRAVIEKVSGMRNPPGVGRTRRSAAVVGAALDDNRARGKQLASARQGRAAGAIRAASGLWSVYGFNSLDDAIDWLQTMTQDKSRFIYAAAYEKGSDGTAFIQDEEFGTGPTTRTVSGRAA